MTEPLTPPDGLQPGKPIPMMLEHELYAAEMEAEGFLTCHNITEPVRLTLLRLLIAYRQVKDGCPLIMPEEGPPAEGEFSTFRSLSAAHQP